MPDEKNDVRPPVTPPHDDIKVEVAAPIIQRAARFPPLGAIRLNEGGKLVRLAKINTTPI